MLSGRGTWRAIRGSPVGRSSSGARAGGRGDGLRTSSRLLGRPPAAWIDIDPRKIGGFVGGAQVVAPSWLDRPAGSPRPLVLVYVASHGARPLIEADLASRGYAQGEDVLFVG